MPESTAKAPALLIDAMLGSLARRLRWLGYDAEYRSDLPDAAMIAIAAREGRLLVTRDRGLATRRGVHALFLAAADLAGQCQEVIAAIGSAGAPPRCTVCNGELIPLSVQEATALAPPYVASTQTTFARCAGCRRVYWPGTHWPGLQSWEQV